ncbi:MAG: NAD(P)H-dependent oxidoreductase [Candidatus Omnitrophota bacterium]|nr:MAG: NAD(P)H-dependent oxidoreductase [Candidatus Omnitrophota bacterium]
MKTAIIFYSFSGNTRRAAQFLKEQLAKKGVAADLIDLKLKEDVKAFFKQCQHALFKKTPELVGADYNLEKYGFLMFSSPVWAFTITPALRSYLGGISSLENKKAACFLTYGSGSGSAKALRELESVLREKGAHIMFSKNLSGFRTKNTTYLEERFRPLLEIITP